MSVKSPTQQDQVYEFIKGKGRAFTHEVNVWGDNNHINSSGSRARELKAKGLIWRMNREMKKLLYGDCKEEVWSVLKQDKEQPCFIEVNKQLVFIS